MSKKSSKPKSRKEHDQMKRDKTSNVKSASGNKPASNDKPIANNKPASTKKSVSSKKPSSSTNKLVMSKDSIIEKCKKILKRDNA